VVPLARSLCQVRQSRQQDRHAAQLEIAACGRKPHRQGVAVMAENAPAGAVVPQFEFRCSDERGKPGSTMPYCEHGKWSGRVGYH
jgi:hypothetical protein